MRMPSADGIQQRDATMRIAACRGRQVKSVRWYGNPEASSAHNNVRSGEVRMSNWCNRRACLR
jgi:hypothetical protein